MRELSARRSAESEAKPEGVYAQPDKSAPAALDLSVAYATGAEEKDSLLDEYRTLAKENRDLAGWIYIAGTAIDYPVMHTPNEPEKYLHRDFDGLYSFAGLPFLDALCSPDETARNQIIYAHNMRSGQMFSALKSYLREDFLETHQAIQYDTLTRRGLYQVFAVLKLNAQDRSAPSMLCYRPVDTTDQTTVDEMNQYLAQYAVIRLDDVRQGDDLLTLSTCEGSSEVGRLVVMARRSKEQTADSVFSKEE